MAYAMVALASDYDCWRPHPDDLDKHELLKEIIGYLTAATANAITLIKAAVERIGEIADTASPAHNALELARRNHDVHVFTALADGLPEKENINGMQVHRLKAAIKFGNASLLTGLLNQLTGFDIIHLHYPFISGAEFVRYASRRSRTPLFVTIHNDLLADGARGIFFRLYQRLSARLSLQNADQLCVVSGDHFSATALASILNGSMLQPVELPNGVDTAVFSPGDTAEIRNRYNIPETAELGLFVAALDRAHHF